MSAKPKRIVESQPDLPVVMAQPERPPSTIPGMTATRHAGWTILRYRLPQTETTSRPLPPAEPIAHDA